LEFKISKIYQTYQADKPNFSAVRGYGTSQNLAYIDKFGKFSNPQKI